MPLALTYMVVEGSIKRCDVEVFENKEFLTPNEEMTIFVNVEVRSVVCSLGCALVLLSSLSIMSIHDTAMGFSIVLDLMFRLI